MQSIFAMARRNVNMSEIARNLNRQDIPYLGGRKWTPSSIGRTLRNSTYLGCSTWRKTTCRLHTPPVPVPAEQWVVKPNAFSPIIDQKTFDRVQTTLKKRLEKWADEEMLEILRRLLRRKGRLTEKIIFNAPNTPGNSTYHHHFGGFANIFRLIGYDPPPGNFLRVERREVTVQLRSQILSQIAELFPQKVTTVHLPGHSRVMVQFDNAIRLSVILCRSRRMRRGTLGWVLNPVSSEREYMTLICRLNRKNDGVHSFLLFDRIDKLKHCMNEHDSWWKAGKRLELWELYEAVKANSVA